MHKNYFKVLIIYSLVSFSAFAQNKIERLIYHININQNETPQFIKDELTPSSVSLRVVLTKKIDTWITQFELRYYDFENQHSFTRFCATGKRKTQKHKKTFIEFISEKTPSLYPHQNYFIKAFVQPENTDYLTFQFWSRDWDGQDLYKKAFETNLKVGEHMTINEKEWSYTKINC